MTSPAAGAETTDEDPLSGDESAHEGHARAAPAPALRYPEVGWRKRARSEGPVDCDLPADDAEPQESQDVGMSQAPFDDPASRPPSASIGAPSVEADAAAGTASTSPFMQACGHLPPGGGPPGEPAHGIIRRRKLKPAQ